MALISNQKYKLSTERRIVKKNVHRRVAGYRETSGRRLGILARGMFLPLLVGLMSVVFIFAHDMIIQWDYLNTTYIQVTGTRHLKPNQVMEQAGISSGMNILKVNIFRAEKRLMAHPWIARAQVRREFPSWIRIHIQEHTPLAIIDLGKRFLLNKKGQIFKQWSDTDPDNLPVITGLGYRDIPCQGVSGSLVFQSALQVLKLGSQPASVLPNHMIKQIDVDRQLGITVYATSDFTGQIQVIKFGFDRYVDKYKLLKTIFSIGSRSNFRQIDINDIDRIIVDPVDTGIFSEDQKEV